MNNLTGNPPRRDRQKAPGPTAVATATPLVWWRCGVLWLTIGAPVVAVLVSTVVAVLAYRDADVALVDVSGPVVKSSAIGGATHRATAPAVSARNHAATPAR